MRIIVAYCRGNRVMGRDNGLPWSRLKGDLPRFRMMTTGHTVIMGRKTWESMGSKPLPGRRNVVMTRDASTWGNREGAIFAGDWEPDPSIEAYVIGGAQIYGEFLHRGIVREVIATEVHEDHAGDTYFPELGPGWEEIASERHEGYDLVRYSRADP